MVLRYMLTGASPQQTITQAVTAQESQRLTNCLLSPFCWRPPARRICEPESLSAGARDLLTILCARTQVHSIHEIHCHEWVARGGV